MRDLTCLSCFSVESLSVPRSAFTGRLRYSTRWWLRLRVTPLRSTFSGACTRSERQKPSRLEVKSQISTNHSTQSHRQPYRWTNLMLSKWTLKRIWVAWCEEELGLSILMRSLKRFARDSATGTRSSLCARSWSHGVSETRTCTSKRWRRTEKDV